MGQHGGSHAENQHAERRSGRAQNPPSPQEYHPASQPEERQVARARQGQPKIVVAARVQDRVAFHEEVALPVGSVLPPGRGRAPPGRASAEGADVRSDRFLVQPLHAAGDVGRLIGSVIEDGVGGDDRMEPRRIRAESDRLRRGAEKRFQAIRKRRRGGHRNLGLLPLRSSCGLGDGRSIIKHSRPRAAYAVGGPLLQSRVVRANSRPVPEFHAESFEKEDPSLPSSGREAAQKEAACGSLAGHRSADPARYDVGLLLDADDVERHIDFVGCGRLLSGGTELLLSRGVHAGRIPFWSPYPWSRLSVSGRSAGGRVVSAELAVFPDWRLSARAGGGTLAAFVARLAWEPIF